MLDADAGVPGEPRCVSCAWEDLGEASGPLSRRSRVPQTDTLVLWGVGVSLMICSTFYVDGSAAFGW